MAINGLTHAIMDQVFSQLKAHAQLSGGTKGLIFGHCLRLNPYFVYVSREGSDVTVQHSLARLFAALLYNKFRRLVCKLS